MLSWLVEPFDSEVVQRALFAGVVVACLCAVVGTWMVLRGSAFLGDAMSHGVLPGVAIASLLGGNVFVGAMIAALAMAYGVSAVSGGSRLSDDTTIGLMLVGMLATGVIIVSHSRSHAVDLTGFLFGDVLAVRDGDIAFVTAAFVVTTVAAAVGRRAFIAATFDPRKATTLRLRPKMAQAALTVLIALAIVASFRVVGTLLVFGLLIAPTAAAALWARSIPQIMFAAAMIGAAAVALGLVLSWHADTAGGATIAAVAVGSFFVSLGLAALHRHARRAAALVMAAVCVAGCGGGDFADPDTASTAESSDGDRTPPPGAEESAEPVTRLIVVDPVSGGTSVLDLLSEVETPLGRFGGVEKLSGDGRFGYLHGRDELTIVDAGSWTFDHGDHNHYYVSDPAVVGAAELSAATVTASRGIVAVRTTADVTRLFDREALEEGEIAELATTLNGSPSRIIPNPAGLLAVTETGQVHALDESGAAGPSLGPCRSATDPVVLSRSVVLGCEHGALRISAAGFDLAATSIPFPADKPDTPLAALHHRSRHGVLTGIAGDEIWVLDNARQTWSVVTAPGVVAVNAGDDGELLALTRDGVLRTVDIATGDETSSLRLFPDMSPADPPALEVDGERAYVNNSATGEIYEIDYRDRLRMARTFRTNVAPVLIVLAGR